MVNRMLNLLSTLLKLGVGCNMVAAVFFICAALGSGIPMVGAVIGVVAVIAWIANAEKRQLGLSSLLFAVTFFVALGCQGLAV